MLGVNSAKRSVCLGSDYTKNQSRKTTQPPSSVKNQTTQMIHNMTGEVECINKESKRNAAGDRKEYATTEEGKECLIQLMYVVACRIR